MSDLSKNLRFPYAWSNPAVSDEKLVTLVLDRGMFDDVCRLALKLGVPALRAAVRALPPDAERDVALNRMLRNIEAGLSRA